MKRDPDLTASSYMKSLLLLQTLVIRQERDIDNSLPFLFLLKHYPPKYTIAIKASLSPPGKENDIYGLRGTAIKPHQLTKDNVQTEKES